MHVGLIAVHISTSVRSANHRADLLLAHRLAKMKDINVLVIGMRGVGVETAKNLILSNVGSVTVHDPATAQV